MVRLPSRFIKGHSKLQRLGDADRGAGASTDASPDQDGGEPCTVVDLPPEFLQFSEVFTWQLESGATTEYVIPVDPSSRVSFVPSTRNLSGELDPTLFDGEGTSSCRGRPVSVTASAPCPV